MAILRRFRLTIADVMMLVLTVAAASALFAKVNEHSAARPVPSWKYDAPALVTVAIGLTAVSLGALKAHSAGQTMLQATVAYLGYLSLICLAEAGQTRVLLYWFQTAFAVTVALPMLARRFVKTGMPRGPRRTWWKKTLEALVFSFLNVLLVGGGALIQFLALEFGIQLLFAN